MKTITKPNYINNEQGQALLFVIVAITVALAVGVAVSSRTISSVKRVASTDTSQKVFSTAEGGVEWFMRQPTDVLNNLANDTPASCPAETTGGTDSNGEYCVLSFPSVSDDQITAQAVVTVDYYNYNSPANYVGGNHRILELSMGEVKEVALTVPGSGNYYKWDLDICWTSKNKPTESDLYISVYNAGGINEKFLLNNALIPHTPATEATSAGITMNAMNSGNPSGFDHCIQYNVPNGGSKKDEIGLRIKSLYADSKVGVFPSSGHDLPYQGYKITSKGELHENDAIRTTKTIVTYRSFPFMPGIFDDAVYSPADLRRNN